MSEAEKCLDILLKTPIEALKHWTKENPEKFAALRYVLNGSIDKIRKDGQTKSGDTLVLSVDRTEDLFAVDYCGLVGYDSVTFHCTDALAAEKLFEALQNVDDIECD